MQSSSLGDTVDLLLWKSMPSNGLRCLRPVMMIMRYPGCSIVKPWLLTRTGEQRKRSSNFRLCWMKEDEQHDSLETWLGVDVVVEHHPRCRVVDSW